MIKYTVILSCLCFFFACRPHTDKNNFANLIKGDWIGLEQSPEYLDGQKIFGCFADSTYQKSLKNDTFQYEITKDTLYLKYIDYEGNNTKSKFSIIKLTTDSLVLLGGVKQEYSVKFSKIRAKNKIIPATICFASSGCFGSCPRMYLEIDSSRNFRFYGEGYTSLKGGFSGRINVNEYNAIVRKIRNLPLDSLREFYELPLTDQQTLGVSIIHDNTITRSSAYGYGEEPMELRILFAKLINLYKHISMVPDTSVNKSFAMRCRELPGFTVPKIKH